AARNSCSGPWQPSLDLQLNWRPAWFGLDRRLTMSLLRVNLLGGLDEWLHGGAHLHGWGYAPAPDPVLLYARGFDPTTNQFRYAVNGRFGGIASASGGVTVPFQVAEQAHLAVGPGPIRRSATRHRTLDLPAPPTPPPPNPLRPPTRPPRASDCAMRSAAPPTRSPSYRRSPTRSTRGTGCFRSRSTPPCGHPQRGTTPRGRSSVLGPL